MAVRQLVVHDLRGPLAVILGQCDLIALRGDLTDADAASLASVRTAAEKVLAMIDEAGDLLPRRS